MNANSKSRGPRAPASLAAFALAATAFGTVCFAGIAQYTYDTLGRLTQVVYDSPPGAPGTPTFSGVTGTTASVTWTAASITGSAAYYQYILYPTGTTPPSTWTTVPGGNPAGTATSISLSALVGGVGYTFSVRAHDALGVTGPSASGTFQTPNPLTSAFTASTVTFQGVGGEWTADAEYDLYSNGTINESCSNCTVENAPAGNWFVPGTNPANYQAVAGNNGCPYAEGTFGTWQSLGGNIGWSVDLPNTAPNAISASCTMTISVRAAVNPSVTLGSTTVTFNIWTGT